MRQTQRRGFPAKLLVHLLIYLRFTPVSDMWIMWYSASQEPLNIGRTFAYSHMCRPNMPRCPSEQSLAYCIWTGPSIPIRKDQRLFGDNLQVHFKPLQRAVIFNVWGLKDERPEWQDSAFLLCTDIPACSNVNEQSNSCNILQQNGIKLTLDHEPFFLQGSVDVVRSLVAWFAYRKSRNWGPLDPLLSYNISTFPVAGLWAPFRPGPGRQLLSRECYLLSQQKCFQDGSIESQKSNSQHIFPGQTSQTLRCGRSWAFSSCCGQAVAAREAASGCCPAA